MISENREFSEKKGVARVSVVGKEKKKKRRRKKKVFLYKQWR